MMLTTQPIVLPMVHRAPLTSLRRWKSEIAMGIPYDTAKEITPTETNARNADDDPRFISPSNICTTVVCGSRVSIIRFVKESEGLDSRCSSDTTASP